MTRRNSPKPRLAGRIPLGTDRDAEAKRLKAGPPPLDPDDAKQKGWEEVDLGGARERGSVHKQNCTRIMLTPSLICSRMTRASKAGSGPRASKRLMPKEL